MEVLVRLRTVIVLIVSIMLWMNFGETKMPLNKKGKKILKSMKKTYGKKKGKNVFYASINKGKVKGVKKGKTT